MQEGRHKPVVSLGFCKTSLRGIGRTQPELSWHAERLLSRYFEIEYSDTPEFLIYGDDGSGEHLDYPSKTIRIFVTGENIRANWSEADYALTHERLYSDRHWRIPLHRHWYDSTCSVPMRDFETIKARVDKFCNFIYSNPNATQRIAFFDRLSQYRRVDSGGKVRNNMSYRIDDKLAFIARSKFTIAFENESEIGYSTEKIIQPLLHGSIPIYWGDPSIESDFNPDSFINVHRFKNFDEVVDLVRRIDQDEDLWRKYVTAPIFRDNVIPAELSDEALVAFFGRVFAERRRHVSRASKLSQRARYRFLNSSAWKDALRIGRGGKRRIDAIGARLHGTRNR
jgi:hypothetical protein